MSVNRLINIPHTHRVNLANPVRFVKVNSLAGYGRFVSAVREPTTGFTLSPPEKPPNMLRLSSFAAKHSSELLGLPGTLPRQSLVYKPKLE